MTYVVSCSLLCGDVRSGFYICKTHLEFHILKLLLAHLQTDLLWFCSLLLLHVQLAKANISIFPKNME